jgi:FolB domain-containing protein
MTSSQPASVWPSPTSSDHNSNNIFIRDLLLRFTIGINDGERATKTDILINIVMGVTPRNAAVTENLADTVDYSFLHTQLVALADSRQFVLIETLAEKIADLALQHELVRNVLVRVEKPGILKYAHSAGIEVTRFKK